MRPRLRADARLSQAGECGSNASGCSSTSPQTARKTSCPLATRSWTAGALLAAIQAATSHPTRSMSFAADWDVVPDGDTSWVLERDNLWLRVIPGTAHGDGLVVTWAYRISRPSGMRCD